MKLPKVPGMCYIFVSFIPWIVYWVMGTVESIIIALIILVLLLIPQVIKANFNIMDVVSLLYFSSALIGTLVFDMDIFIVRPRLLGYSVLSFMALFSLIIKQPYTLQVSKRDYPEVMWKDESFLAINNVITVAWLVIFLASAVIYLVLWMPLTVILANILIVCGIAFSIIFPAKAPAYLLTKKFKEYDWKAKADPSRTKEEDEYDVVIVGSGIGGLSCGATLSKKGYKVLILEQHYQAGGYCSSFKRKGFTFNTGVENVSGLWSGGPVSCLLQDLGLNKEELFIKNRMQYVFKGGKISANSLEEFMKEISSMFPAEKDSISAFFSEAEKAYKECYSETDDYGVPLPAELIVKAYGEKALSDYPKKHPHFFGWMNTTYKQKLDEHFKDENLKALLCALVGYLGTEPEKTPAASALTACVAYYLYGGYFTVGGAQKFADSLKDSIEDRGGKVLLRHKVDKILVESGVVGGVQARGKTYKSRVVVSNADAKTTFLKLVGAANLKDKFVRYIEGLKMSPSCLMVSLGVDMNVSGYPTILHNLDEEYNLVFNSNADPSMAPKGKASLSILTGAFYGDFPERGTEEYLQKKNKLAEELLEKVERVVPDLRKKIIVQDVATPKTFERYTSIPEGAIYVFDQSVGAERPYFKTPVEGLYLVGASTFPGGGIEAVVISGVISANDIYGWSR